MVDTTREVVHVIPGAQSYGVALAKVAGHVAEVNYMVTGSREEMVRGTRDDAGLRPRVNWPALGDVSPADARRFALAILEACEAAETMVPRVIAAREAHNATV